MFLEAKRIIEQNQGFSKRSPKRPKLPIWLHYFMVQMTAFNAENLSLSPSLDWMCALGAVKAGACLVNGGALDTF
jgi:hypothetical protein